MDTGTGFTEVKTAHCPGFVQLVPDSTGHSRKILSCGPDGIVFAWDAESLLGSKAPSKHTVADRTHSTIAWRGDEAFIGYTHVDIGTGIERQVLARFPFPTLDRPLPGPSPLSFSLEVTAIDVSEHYLIGGCSDFTVKKQRRGESDYIRFDLEGQTLSIAIDPKEELFAISTCEGVVSIFEIKDDSATPEPIARIKKAFRGFGDLDEGFPRVFLAWSSDGEFLFIPTTGGVKKVPRGHWQESKDLRVDKWDEEVFSLCTLSNCGKFLAATTVSSKIVVWRLSDGVCVNTGDYKKLRNATITGIAFLPDNPRHLVLADYKEGVSVFLNALPTASQEQPRREAKTTTEKKSRRVDDEDEEEMPSERDSFDDDFDPVESSEAAELGGGDEDDDDDGPSTRRKSVFIDDDVEDDCNTRMSAVSASSATSLTAIKRQFGFAEDQMNAEGDDFLAGLEKREGKLADPFSRAKTLATVPSFKEYVPPRAPAYAASAASPVNLSQRYLKWNGIGMVREYDNDGETSLEISFHDSSIHADILVPNTGSAYVVADLNEHVVALANRAGEKESSQLFVYHLRAWESNSGEWKVDLPKGEQPLDVAVSSQLVVLLTSTRFVRVFSHTGVQRHVFSHPSPPLMLAARDDRIAIASVAGGAIFTGHKEDGEETEPEFPVSVTEYRAGVARWWTADASSSPPSTTTPLALSPASRLMWMAYTNRGRLVTADTKTIVRLLVAPSRWSPIFSGAHQLTSRSDAVWPIAVMEAPKKEIRYVYCRGIGYPLATLKLTPVVAPWNSMVCAQDTDKSRMEEELMHGEILLSRAAAEGDKAEMKDLASKHLTTIVKLFALACKAEKETRAADLATMMTTSRAMNSLASYAAKQRRNALMDKVQASGAALADEEEERLEREEAGRASYAHSSSFARPSTTASSSITDAPIGGARKTIVRRSGVLPSTQSTVKDEDSLFLESLSEEDDYGSVSTVQELPSEPTRPVMPFVSGADKERNPFKRGPSTPAVASSLDTSSLSVFDEMDSPGGPARKRLKEIGNSEPAARSPAQKQAKLSFGGAGTAIGGGKKTSGYEIWLAENEERLKGEFMGADDDFAKFCTQQFRMLKPDQKKVWLKKAEGTAA